jgi:predicted dehydrogenase
MLRKIKFGIVGLGHIGIRHALCINQHTQGELIGGYDVLDKDKWKVKNLKVKYNSISQLMNDDIDVVNICTPNYLHANIAIDALRHGKHVVIEKPMSLSVKDSEAIITASKEAKKSVFCVMQNRFSPTIIWLKNIISNNMLGDIKMVSIHCFWNRNNSYYLNSDWHGSKNMDGGPLYTQFSHFIDIIYWLFGDISTSEADFYSFNQANKFIEFEDSGLITFTFKKGSGRGVLNYSTAVWDKNLESSITIIGEKGSVKIGGQYMDTIDYCHIEDYTLPNINTDVKCNDYGDYKGSASNHDKMINNVIEVLLGDSEIHTNASDGLQVVNIIEKIYSLRI